MTLSIQDQNLLAQFNDMVRASAERVKEGRSLVERDAQGNMIPTRSKLKPNIFQTEHTLSADIGKPIS